jgi:Carbohydrate esterase, sialic acid-specific acetylesterase
MRNEWPRLVALGLLVAAGPLRVESAAPMKLFILSGQSNCVGNGDGDKLPPELAAAAPNLMMWSESAKAWKPLAPVPSNPVLAKMYHLGAMQFGPEISFGHAMRQVYPDHRIGIVKVAIGGTSVLLWNKDFGSPEWTALMDAAGLKHKESDSFYARLLLLQVTHALEKAKAEGPVEVAGFIWVQTERDSMLPATAQAWAKRVVQLHRDLAADAGYSPEVPVIVMAPHFHIFEKDPSEHAAKILAGVRAASAGGAVDLPRLKEACGLAVMSDADFTKELGKMRCFLPNGLQQIEGVGIMQRGLDELAKQHSNLRVVRSDDLPTHEGLHFDTAGQIELGRRIAETIR